MTKRCQSLSTKKKKKAKWSTQINVQREGTMSYSSDGYIVPNGDFLRYVTDKYQENKP